MSHKLDKAAKLPPDEEATHVDRGVAGFALSLKVAAFLPLVLLSGVVVGRLGLFDSGSEPSGSASHSSQVVDRRTPSLSALPDTGRDPRKAPGKKAGKNADRPTDEPSPSDSASASSTPSGPSSSPSSPSSSPTATRSPSRSQSPSPTPTPEEARQQCKDEGVNPLDLDAMAECIADIIGGG